MPSTSDSVDPAVFGQLATGAFVDNADNLDNLALVGPVGTGKTRFCGKCPCSSDPLRTMIGALTLKGLGALMTVEGATTGNIFIAFVQACLVPTLKSGDVVVMDNLAAHKVKPVRRLIEAAGARVLFLPAYSPDLNPIDECWSKVKANLRRIEARNVVDLRRAIATAADLFTGKDAVGWIGHAGDQVN